MALHNKTRKTILCKTTVPCTTVLAKARGLMFAPPLHDRCLVFVFDRESYVSLHMFFVFFPIDVAYLDTHKRIVDIKQRVMPFTPLVRPTRASRYIIELAAGTIAKSRTRIGDTLSF